MLIMAQYNHILNDCKNLICTKVSYLVNLIENVSNSRSIMPLTFGLSCCAIEMMETFASYYDLDQYGVVMRTSPRQSDLLIISGTVTKKMGPYIKTLYTQIPEKKYVIAMGICTISGGLFKNSNNVISNLNEFIPVNIFIKGCPPVPEKLIKSIYLLKNMIANNKVKYNIYI